MNGFKAKTSRNKHANIPPRISGRITIFGAATFQFTRYNEDKGVAWTAKAYAIPGMVNIRWKDAAGRMVGNINGN